MAEPQASQQVKPGMTSRVPPSAVVATGLRKSFGDHVVLDGVELDVAEGRD